jgi:hypothetical protein
MALVAGLITEEIIKDVVIPWWVSSEVASIGAGVIGTSIAAVVEESKDPVQQVS